MQQFTDARSNLSETSIAVRRIDRRVQITAIVGLNIDWKPGILTEIINRFDRTPRRLSALLLPLLDLVESRDPERRHVRLCVLESVFASYIIFQQTFSFFLNLSPSFDRFEAQSRDNFCHYRDNEDLILPSIIGSTVHAGIFKNS